MAPEMTGGFGFMGTETWLSDGGFEDAPELRFAYDITRQGRIKQDIKPPNDPQFMTRPTIRYMPIKI